MLRVAVSGLDRMSRLDELFKGLPPQLDVQQVADVLGTSKQGVYRWINLGVIPAYKIGSSWMILRDELKDTIAAGSNLSGAREEGHDSEVEDSEQQD